MRGEATQTLEAHQQSVQCVRCVRMKIVLRME